MFSKFVLDRLDSNLYEELSKSTIFESSTKGREGAIIVDCKNNLIPLVRSTTAYEKPPQTFSPVHQKIIECIREAVNRESKIKHIEFNNAMVEIYDYRYRSMRYHSDLALDLENDSYICLFSCYSDPQTKNVRKLKIKPKTSGDIKNKSDTDLEESKDIILCHNSIVLFSTTDNEKWLHKIILDTHSGDRKTKWLGITFRLSKTFIDFREDVPYIFSINSSNNSSNNSLDNSILRLATDDDKAKFLEHRRNENINIGYVYPKIEYTISKSDLVCITKKDAPTDKTL